MYLHQAKTLAAGFETLGFRAECMGGTEFQEDWQLVVREPAASSTYTDASSAQIALSNATNQFQGALTMETN